MTSAAVNVLQCGNAEKPMTGTPDEHKQDEAPGRWDVAIDLLLPATRTLRRALPINEATVRAHTFHGQPRAFVLWRVIDELEKVAMYLMRLDGFLGDADNASNETIDSFERTSRDLVLEEIHLRARRLCEVMTLLVLFAQTNDEAYFRHFMLLQSYLGARWFNEELAEFHGAESACVNLTANAELASINEAEKQVAPGAMWYARYQFPLAPKGASWKGITTNQRERFKRALPQMRNFERMALGGAYFEAFSRPSASIHFSPGGDVDVPASVKAAAGQLGILGFCVASRAFELLGEPEGAEIQQIHRVVTANEEGPRRLELLNVRAHIEIGDFVVALGFLGEVIEATKSAYDYRSFRVLFLEDRPRPDLVDDWFRARDVSLFFSRAKLDEGVKALVGQVGDGEDYRSAVRAAWQLRREVCKNP